MKTIFVTGIGTDVGKTIVSAIITEALEADYWKPIQAGGPGTDNETVATLVTNKKTIVHPEIYKFKLAASPHISARNENQRIDPERIIEAHSQLKTDNDWLVVEGAGGLMVPLNENSFVSDLIGKMEAKVVIVSRNYLGSINHSLLTSRTLASMGIHIAGWIFNDQYLDYEDEIAYWSGYPKIGSVPLTDNPDATFIKVQAAKLKDALINWA